MLQSVIDSLPDRSAYPELARARVLVTGLSPRTGVDIARAFADQGARLVLQMQDDSIESQTLLEVLARTADEVRVFPSPFADQETAVAFAQKAAAAYGGLDVVVNLIALPDTALADGVTVQQIEDIVAARLGPACLITRIAANRMRLTWTNGLVLNVLAAARPSSSRQAALGSIARAALATMTRAEALAWAGEGVRINAVGPRDAAPMATPARGLRGEPDIAALALFLASARGRDLTGHVFDLDQVASGCR